MVKTLCSCPSGNGWKCIMVDSNVRDLAVMAGGSVYQLMAMDNQ